MTQPFLRRRAQPKRPPLRWTKTSDRTIIQFDGVWSRPLFATKRIQQLTLAISGNAGDAQDFASADGEGYPL
jgi:hypothetical protein